MSILTVGPNSSFPTISAAMLAAGPADTILLETGYSNESATVTHSGMTVSGDASSTGIVLQLGAGIATFFLGGTASIDVLADASGGNGIAANAGDNVVTVTGGIDAVDGGLGTDRLVVDYHLATGAVSGNSTSNFSEEGGGGRSVTITDGTFENFTVLTGAGADTLTVGDGNNIVAAGDGANTITAGNGQNDITGGSDADTITAGDGGNTIHAGNGTNTVTSGLGDDAIYSGTGADTIVAGGGVDTITVLGGSDSVDGGAGSDRLIVDYSAMTTDVTGGVTGGNFLTGYTAHVADTTIDVVNVVAIEAFTITTGSGNDSIATGGGNDIIDGGTGNDVLRGAQGNDTLYGGDGNDLVYGGAGDDFIDGGNGADTVAYDTNATAVTVSLAFQGTAQNTGAGLDTLTHIENLTGSAFNDALSGDANANTLTGGAGDDVLRGAQGNDNLYGGSGNDTLVGGAGDDFIDGGDGSDTLTYDTATSAVTIDLGKPGQVIATGAQGNDTFVNVENVLGSNFNDALTGSVADNTLTGGSGNDVIKASGGNDQVFGGAGNDNITGGAGNDILDGGTGADTFVFNANFGQDTINQFDTTAGSEHDLIDFSTSVFATFADVQAHMAQTGTDATITLDASNSITLHNVTGTLAADSFLFHA